MKTGLRPAPAAPAEAPCCRSCVHFENEPQHLERAFPGWRALGSAYGSARSEDGICGARGLYLSARQWCVQYLPHRS
jgi:hypothetical protein